MPQQSEVSEILEQMTAELREAAERVVPRFLATMPPEYFRGTDAATRLAHIKAIITTEATGLSQELILRNEDGSRITVIRELLRLVDAELAIAEFDPDRLGPKGSVTSLDRPDGFRLRNTLHNRLEADAFIPAGGRPRTLRDTNWKDFLRGDGSPSARVIIEGANLFLTPEARSGLSDAGVLIVRDSSANKCGVICSSFEILASMVLSEEEFVAHKEVFVAQVIERLRRLARLEAELLMRERHHKPDIDLPELSNRISHTMIAATDALVAAIPKLDDADGAMAHNVMQRHVPPILFEVAGDRVFERVPSDYVNSAIAAVLAGMIVYREGLSYLESMSPEALADLAFRYLRQEQETGRLVAQVGGSALADRERIAELLRAGGTGAALRDRFGA